MTTRPERPEGLTRAIALAVGLCGALIAVRFWPFDIRISHDHVGFIGGAIVLCTVVAFFWRSPADSVRHWITGGPPEDDFDHVADLLRKRNDTLKESMDGLAARFGNTELGIDHAVRFRLAAVDLFVEKAQSVLTARARRMFRTGLLASSTAVSALGGLCWYITEHTRHLSEEKALDQGHPILRIVAAISLVAVVLVAVKYLIALARSFS